MVLVFQQKIIDLSPKFFKADQRITWYSDFWEYSCKLWEVCELKLQKRLDDFQVFKMSIYIQSSILTILSRAPIPYRTQTKITIFSFLIFNSQSLNSHSVVEVTCQ